ncbi:MAG TPA: serine/threonine-protein kinase, partial [Usitatibacter sp.]|nr:serine/threonine-protein kinase [Usitatibacter sp.]
MDDKANAGSTGADARTVERTLAAVRAEPGPARAPRRALPPKPQAPDVVLPPGFRLHEYRIDAVLGQGGFGIAYAATDVNLDARVVIKEYLPEGFAYRADDYTVCARTDEDQDFYQGGLDSFLVEARTLATFRHPNIVRVARFFEANKTAYMVLEYERGQSLKSWRKKRDNIPEATIVSLLAPLLDGLAVVHRTGYLHRDIKPDNIYVRDEDGSLVLLDFGAARQTATEKSEIGMVVTPGYGPIEQYAGGGRQGPWTDIYSLGATLFWLVTGKKPVDAPSRLADPDPQPRAEDLCRG